MTRWGVSIFGLAAGGALVLVPGCGSDEFDGCGATLSCVGENSAGTGGAGGTSGASGKGGSGGTSGDGATGQGGGAGSEAGGSGNAGTAGSGEGGTSGSGEGGTAGDAGGAGASGDGGEAGAMGGTGGGETPCDATALPGEDACVIDEEYGVFVSPAGDDGSGEGTKARPYATIGKAISVAVEDGRRVYACADGGEYAESVTLGAEANGLEMFGGFSCADWSYGTSVKSVVRAAGPEALRIAQVEGLRVEDFGFVAADATVAGGSSVAAQVVNSTGVVLRRVRLEAGMGMRGADGVRVDFGFPALTDLAGYPAKGTEGGAARTCDSCPGGDVTVGGGGGDAQPTGASGSNGAPNWGGGKGGAVGTCDVIAQGGGDGPPRENAPGAAIRGVLSAAGWTPATGGFGDSGFPGQGGGGGSTPAPEANEVVGGGGGGGCGGCGGAGGPGGQGGGASLALVVFESDVVVEDSELAAADAGDGGNGTVGQNGQTLGGSGGNSGERACDGGAGGSGGKGGTGGGGAGGISVGVLWSGEAEPTLTDNEFTLGEAGAIGLGGDSGVNDGIVGLAEEVLEVP